MSRKQQEFKHYEENLGKSKRIATSLQLGQKQVFVIGICGGDCSGKRQIVQSIKTFFESKNVQIAFVSQRSFFIQNPQLTKYNPNSYNWDNMVECVRSLKNGKTTQVKSFDENNKQSIIKYQNSNIVIVHGLHILHCSELKSLLNISIFIDSDCDVRLSRRIQKDAKLKKRSLQDSIQNYLFNIKPNYENYTLPLKKIADLLVPKFGGDFIVNQQNTKNVILPNYSSRVIQFLLPAILHTTTIKTNIKEVLKNSSNMGMVDFCS